MAIRLHAHTLSLCEAPPSGRSAKPVDSRIDGYFTTSFQSSLRHCRGAISAGEGKSVIPFIFRFTSVFSANFFFNSDLKKKKKMSENRATKSGLAAEAHNKIQSKYDPELASTLLKWMKEVMGDSVELDTSGDRETFYRQLKDGQILCRLINVLQPGSIPEKKINNTKMAFKCMENINLFLEQVKKLGVPAEETFQTVDLWEEQNLTSVLICLQSLARKASKFGFKSIGPKEAEANVRQFSEEQLKAGQNIISLQYGSNKGANQSGINFGNTRHM